MKHIVLAPLILLTSLSAAATADEARRGYLAPGGLDLRQILSPAPVRGDIRDTADRATFKATRKLVDTPRWALAINDVETSPAAMMRHFSCAVGVRLTPDNAPRLAALVIKAGADTSDQTNAVKRFYRRLRPFQVDDGAVCQDKGELAGSFEYPSGHTTWGWTWATILAELVPDRATAILARGRAYGDSRVVCGAHYPSAVEGGLISASATLAVVRASRAFKADLAEARAELDALRRAPSSPVPAASACRAEATLIAQRVF